MPISSTSSKASSDTASSSVVTTILDDLASAEQQLDAMEKALAARLRAEMAEYEEVEQELASAKQQRDALVTAAENAENAIDDVLADIMKVNTHAAA